MDLLNKLSPEKFDMLCAKFIDTVPPLVVNEKDVHTVVRMIIGKACRDPLFSALYAKLCSHITLSRAVPNFAKILLNECQRQFECKCATPEWDLLDIDVRETKQRIWSLALCKFLGELYREKLLVHQIMVFVIQDLIGQDKDGSSFDSKKQLNLELLCTLMSVIGSVLEVRDAKYLEKCMSQIKQLSENQVIPMRVRCLLLDVIDLRKKSWKRGISNA